MMTFIIWIVFIFSLLAVIGGIINGAQRGLATQEIVGLVFMMIVVTVFGFIALTGSFTI